MLNNAKISIIMPVRNERELIENSIHTLYKHMSMVERQFEILMVDDSNDGTYELLVQLASIYSELIVIKGGELPSYGYSLRRGINSSTGDIVIPFNADSSDSLDDLTKYIDLIENGLDMVFGSRFLMDSSNKGSKGFKWYFSKLANRIVSRLLRIECNDLTNSFKAYRSSIIKNLNTQSLGFDIGMEMAVLTTRMGYNYTTIPLNHKTRHEGYSKMSLIKSIPSFARTLVRLGLIK